MWRDNQPPGKGVRRRETADSATAVVVPFQRKATFALPERAMTDRRPLLQMPPIYVVEAPGRIVGRPQLGLAPSAAVLDYVTTPPEPTPGLTIGTPSVQMAFACEGIQNDLAGRMSFQNIMDGLLAATFPATTPQLYVVFSFLSQTPRIVANCKVTIESATKEAVAEARHRDLSFTPDSPMARNIIGFQGVTWPHAGQYVVKFYGNNNVIAWFPITVQQAPQQTQNIQG